MAIIWSNLEEIEIGQKEREKHKKSIDQPFIDPNREKKEKFAKLICIPKQTTTRKHLFHLFINFISKLKISDDDDDDDND